MVPENTLHQACKQIRNVEKQSCGCAEFTEVNAHVCVPSSPQWRKQEVGTDFLQSRFCRTAWNVTELCVLMTHGGADRHFYFTPTYY